ncbi:MAG TPA: hypothetical protein PKX87_04360 [Alphaproteobacteria bacterium]|nr:hypothetical protein [Alphaproteobacteria bacterium]
MTTTTDTSPLPFETDPMTGRLSLSLEQVRQLVPIFPNPGNLKGYVKTVLQDVDPDLLSGPKPSLSLQTNGLNGADKTSPDAPDLTVVFRNSGGWLYGQPDPTLSIRVFKDPEPERGHTGTFEMVYAGSHEGSSTVKLTGSTYDTPGGVRVVFNPSGSGRSPADAASRSVTGANLRTVGNAFAPKP